MNKNITKIIFTILIITFLVVLPCFSFAGGILRDNVSASLPSQVEQAQNTTKMIISVIKWIGYACAIGMVIFIGIKYVLASADEKASLKGMLVKVVIGSVIIVAAVVITDTVINVVGGKVTTTGGNNTGTVSSSNNNSSSSNGSSSNKPSNSNSNNTKEWEKDDDWERLD